MRAGEEITVLSGVYGNGIGDPTADVGTGGGVVLTGGIDGGPITTTSTNANEAGHIMETRTVSYRYVVQAVVQVGLALLQTDVYVIVQLLALTAE